MPAFWRLARLMLDFKGRLVLALVCAMLSGGGLAAGLLTASPVIDGLFEEKQGLRPMAQAHNLEGSGFEIPAFVVDRLPEDAWASVVLLVAIVAGLAVFAGLCQFGHAFLSLTVVHRTVMRVRRQAFRSLLFMPLLATQRGPSSNGGSVGGSDAVSRLIADAEQLAYGFEALVSKAVTQVTKGLG
ncbi:MAG: ABC transporter transmembrane domain-containing protein, partial [Planctomycetota bacterium]